MIDVQKLEEALTKHGSKRGAVVELGFSYSNSTALKKVCKAIEENGLQHLLSYRKNGRKGTDWSESNLVSIASECTSFSAMLVKLKLVPRGRNIEFLRAKLDAFNISYSHFVRGKVPKTPEEVFVVDRTISHGIVKRNFIRLVDYQCSICNISDWLGIPLTLELDHINGVNYDHRLENLRLICPNCHSQTPTHCRGPI